MPRWCLQLTVLIAVILAIGLTALSRKGEHALSYCCVEHQEAAAAPAPNDVEVGPQQVSDGGRRPARWGWRGDITLTGVFATIIAFLVGFGVGQITVTRAPTAADITRVITAAGTARASEAMLHGVIGAPSLLTRLQGDAIAAVHALLPSPRIAGYVALVLAGVLALAFVVI